jgi:hypothetical protein
MLTAQQVHGVALTDLESRVVGSFSASDLKGLTAKTFDLLALPIGDCITALRASVGLARATAHRGVVWVI